MKRIRLPICGNDSHYGDGEGESLVEIGGEAYVIEGCISCIHDKVKEIGKGLVEKK